MTISANYPTPVLVNGYSCDNCAQVAEAKKGIDPADPKAGPYGVNAANQPPSPGQAPAVTFGGVLSGLSPVAAGSASQPSSMATGSRLDISA